MISPVFGSHGGTSGGLQSSALSPGGHRSTAPGGGTTTPGVVSPATVALFPGVSSNGGMNPLAWPASAITSSNGRLGAIEASRAGHRRGSLDVETWGDRSGMDQTGGRGVALVRAAVGMANPTDLRRNRVGAARRTQGASGAHERHHEIHDTIPRGV